MRLDSARRHQPGLAQTARLRMPPGTRRTRGCFRRPPAPNRSLKLPRASHCGVVRPPQTAHPSHLFYPAASGLSEGVINLHRPVRLPCARTVDPRAQPLAGAVSGKLVDMNEVHPLILAGLPLVGIVVGGVLTWLTQSRADVRREKTALQAEARASKLAAVERRHTHLRALHERTPEDAAEIRLAISKTNAHKNYGRAELLDDVTMLVRQCHDRAGMLIALVDDESVRDKADELYTLWGQYAGEESERMSNGGFDFPGSVSIENLLNASESLTNAVRARLSALNLEEADLFK